MKAAESVATTLVLTLSQLYLDYRRETAAIEDRMSEIADGARQSLGEGLWNLDRRQLALQIDGILRLPAVRFVEVRETTDRGDPMVVSGGLLSSASMVLSCPITLMSGGTARWRSVSAARVANATSSL